MHFIKKILEKMVFNGIDRDTDLYHRNYLIVSNLITYMAIVSGFTFLFIGGRQGYFYLDLGLLIYILISTSVIFFNHYKEFTISIYVIFILNNLAISFFSLLLGKNSGFDNYLFSFPMISYFFIPFEKLKTLIFSTALSIICYITLIYFHQNFGSVYLLEMDTINLFYYFNSFNIFFLLILYGFYFNFILDQTKKELQVEKVKTDSLLLNILPKTIADDLKNLGKTNPKKYDQVTVLFTDFAGFTKIANKMSAEELVKELDNCFSYFDQVTKKYNLEKIKTIGDSYMICGGIPTPNKTHPIDSILAALEIQAFMNQMKEIKSNLNLEFWELRLGINTGSLVAGVIGEMKFVYDVFGDTVNTASRMESSGEIGKINISKSTYELVKDFFDCEFRGFIQAKNKGQIEMYFVNGIKSNFSVNSDGKTPNEEFKRRYDNL